MNELISTREAYGKALEEIAENSDYSNVVVLDADLSTSTKTCLFAKKQPHRFFQMGISEQDMIGTAVGLALSGKIPFVSTFAIFGSRAWEQIRNSVARMNLPVRLCFSHGGITVGEDGASAQANEDIAIMRAIPNMKVFIPADAIETKRIIYYLAKNENGPAYVRLTRNAVPPIPHTVETFEPGKAEILKAGNDGSIIACGQMVKIALEAHNILSQYGYSVRIINMPSIKPVDKDLLEKTAKETKFIITIEEHSIIGGLGSAVCETICETYPVEVIRIGINDKFGKSGSAKELLAYFNLTPDYLVNTFLNYKKKNNNPSLLNQSLIVSSKQ
jgi:transketolase